MSDTDAVYVIAIRSSGPKNGREVIEALESLNNVTPVTAPAVAAFTVGEATSAHHDALRALGFTFGEANSVVGKR